MKKTAKAASAVVILAKKYQTSPDDVSAVFSLDEIYSDLAKDGWLWHAETQKWIFTRTLEHFPPDNERAGEKIRVNLRVVGDSVLETTRALRSIVARLEHTGARVTFVSSVKPNRDSEGARVYLDVEL